MELKENYLEVLGAVALVNMLGVLASMFGMPGAWYQSLAKPAFTPPNYLFPIAWTVLYSLIGVSGYIAYKQDFSSEAKTLFVVQLAANLLWTPVFFGLQSPLYGLVVISVLVVSLIVTIKKFYEENPLSAYLLLPYLVWVLYAAYLNASIYLLN